MNDADTKGRPPDPSAGAPSRPGRGRILVVDDEPNARNALRALLTDEGYAVESAADGVNALGKLPAFAAELVLTDLEMPRMGGLELLRHLHERDADLPVVVMSAFGDSETARGTLRAGARHFLAKPVNLDQLTAVMDQELLRRRERRQPDTMPGGMR